MLLKKNQLRQLACIGWGDMNSYETKQLEFETEQLLNYVAMPTIDVCKKL